MSSSRLLYHYTSAEALLGILQSGSLWATDIRFLNDTAEFSFAYRVLLRELHNRAGRLRNERVRSIVQDELAEAASRTNASAYVISFSEHGNALSQWRAYAPRDGVAIGFHPGALRSVEDFALSKCQYLSEDTVETSAGRRALMELVDDVYESVRWTARLIQQEARKKTHTEASRLEAQMEQTSMVTSQLIWTALKVKHGGFSEEREWRLIDNSDAVPLVHSTGDDSQERLKFRRGVFGVTPYIVATLPANWRGAPLGIARVIVGPSANVALTTSSIKDLLRIRLRSSAPVVPCNIPFRAW